MRPANVIRIFACTAGVCASLVAQPVRDTSFTIHSAARSIASRFPSARLAELVLPSNVRTVERIPFTVTGDHSLVLDLFRPSDTSMHYPGVILLFGGGWRSGDRSQSAPMAQRIASAGFVCAAIDYRLSGEARYPAAVHDVKAAIRWMRANAERYGLDTSFVAVLGCSAGGQLAALVGTTNGDRQFEGEGGNGTYSSAVQAVIDVDGILDFSDPAESGKDTIEGEPSAGARWLGTTFREDPARWHDASPVAHAGAATPPICFINSAIPRFHAGRDSMIAILARYGVWTDLHTFPDTPHPFWLFHPWFAPTCDAAVSFLKRVTSPSPR